DCGSVGEQDSAVGLQSSRGHRMSHFRHVDVRLRDGYRRTNIVTLCDLVLERFGDDRAEWIHRYDRRWIAPLRIGTDRIGRHRVREIRLVAAQQVAGRDSERTV